MNIVDRIRMVLSEKGLGVCEDIEESSEDIQKLKTLDTLKGVEFCGAETGAYLGDAVYGVTYQATAATADTYSDPKQFLIDAGFADTKKEIDMVPVKNKGKPDEYRPLTFTVESSEGPVQLNLMLFNPDYGKPAEAPAQPAGTD